MRWNESISREMHKDEIVAYYDKTRYDYQVFWFQRHNRAAHFGYFGKGIRSHGASLTHLNEVMSNKAVIGTGDIILDAGCGQGSSSLWLAATFQDVLIKGITLVPHQVAIAQKESLKRKLSDRVTFELADYCRTAFPDQSFTVIWACESICHAPDKYLFYQEAFRLLKPGGRLIVADGIRKLRFLPREEEVILEQWLKGWRCPDLDTWEEHRNNLARAGFAHMNFEDVTQFMKPSLKRLCRLSRNWYPFGCLLWRLGLRHRIAHENLVSAIRQYEALEMGLWSYGIFSALKPLAGTENDDVMKN